MSRPTPKIDPRDFTALREEVLSLRNGIHVYRFNTQSGEFKQAQPVTELPNASYLAISDDRQNVYAVSEGGQGSVNAYTFDPESGMLTFLNTVPSQGPCYVSVDDGKKVVFSGNYGGGNALAIPLQPDGSLVEDKVQTVQHEGSSVNQQRQSKPHVHSVVLSPDDRYLLVPDLGTDKVYQYKVNATQKDILTPADEPFLAVKPGGGPRHLTFHPNGKYAYLVLEMEGAVMALDYRDGKLAAKQTISMVAPDFKGQLSGADIHVSPDGKFLYASNRGEANEIAIYAIDKKGSLTMVGRQSVLGKTPRNFAIDPTGNYLLAANQDTREVIIFKRLPSSNAVVGLVGPTMTSHCANACAKSAAIRRRIFCALM
jgi:6-phosphogluconolactonase